MAVDFPAIAEKEYVCGATVWCWADHAWPPNTYGFATPAQPVRVLTRTGSRRRRSTLREMFRRREKQAWRRPETADGTGAEKRVMRGRHVSG